MLNEFLKKLDEIVPLSSSARLQQTDQSKAVDFYAVSGFQARNTLKCKLFSSLAAYSTTVLLLHDLACHYACQGFGCISGQ